jgi:nucleotide-binding universal stress UspA family protein
LIKTKTMRKIALPTDLSNNALNALEYAVALFNEPSKFYLLHAYADQIFGPETLDLSDDELEFKKTGTAQNCEALLKPVIESLLKKFSDCQHQFVVMPQCGYLIDEINRLVEKENIDVIVMGTRGKTNDRNLTFGSNTLQVIKLVQCPVLCIPENHKFKIPKKLLFPTNYMIPYQKRELKLVGEICSYYGAETHILYVSNFGVISKRQKSNQTLLKTSLDVERVHFHQVEMTSKTNIINESIEKMGIDLLVMVNSRYSYLESLMVDSTIDKIGLQPKIPFLILQNYNRN